MGAKSEKTKLWLGEKQAKKEVRGKIEKKMVDIYKRGENRKKTNGKGQNRKKKSRGLN